jgi:protein gp37
MSDNSTIEWTDATWNPITGCSVVSPGCTNCYAMGLAGTRLKHHWSRKGLTQDTKAGPVWNGQVRLNEEWLDQPLRWMRPRMIFACAHGDLFHEDVPDAWIDRVFAVMALAPQHTFQVLTKRAKRMRAYLTDPLTPRRIYWLQSGYQPGERDPNEAPCTEPRPLPNVWLGVSAERQKEADERIPELLATPAAVRFVSAEPLLGPIDFRWIAEPNEERDGVIDALKGRNWVAGGGYGEPFYPARPGHQGRIMDRAWAGPQRGGLSWIIVGGESGPGARPMHPDWARSIRDQCAAAGVPFFFKQWGEWAPVSHMDEAAINACYAPAPDVLPDATRRRIKQSFVLQASGAIFMPCEPCAFAQGSGAMTMFAIGKKHAGRLLDGVTHDAMPGRAG